LPHTEPLPPPRAALCAATPISEGERMHAHKDTTEDGGAVSAAVSALTPEQFDIVQTRIHFVPPRWREKFLRAVGDQLALVQSPTNKDVLSACAVARRAICVGIGAPSVENY
jgi:hypothetical protein